MRKKTWKCFKCIRAEEKKAFDSKKTTTTTDVDVDVQHMMEPTMNDLERRQRRGSLSRSTVSLRSRICVFVLGPSAAGKTFLTFSKLPRVLHLNGLTLDGANFVSVDGGLMRDTSMIWKYTKSLPVRGCVLECWREYKIYHSIDNRLSRTLRHSKNNKNTQTHRYNSAKSTSSRDSSDSRIYTPSI